MISLLEYLKHLWECRKLWSKYNTTATMITDLGSVYFQECAIIILITLTLHGKIGKTHMSISLNSMTPSSPIQNTHSHMYIQKAEFGKCSLLFSAAKTLSR